MRRGPITALVTAMAAALLCVGCENRFNTSFVLQPGGSARFSAEGDRAFAVIRNRGPSQIIATFSAEGTAPAAKEIPANTMHGEAIKQKSVTLLGGTGEAVIDIEVQNATGFQLNLSPNTGPATTK
ncbi:MAG: hypothetical protein JNL80_05995 [Phycisphaerae bacterium]|jgi:hypothetical protein|nr:hypothetical protein [Phycisphaerae bacterium]